MLRSLLQIGSVLVFTLLTCETVRCIDESLIGASRVIGAQSLDPSNFVVHIDGNGTRFREVPYQYMKQRIQDQKMWRTWSIALIVLCFIFFGILVAYLIHDFRMSTGVFSFCRKRVSENVSDDKIMRSESAEYSRADNPSMYNSLMDDRTIPSFQNAAQL